MSKGDVLRLELYLRHILEAIERCRRYVDDYDEVAVLEGIRARAA